MLLSRRCHRHFFRISRKFTAGTVNHDDDRIIFSAIQPTGVLHLGNYFGAVEHWVKLQNENKHKRMLISVVDLHATTIFKVSPVLNTLNGSGR